MLPFLSHRINAETKPHKCRVLRETFGNPSAQPSLDSKLIRELAACRWLGNGDALLLLGPPGVGKTHLAVALGRQGIQHSYSTLFTSATALVTALTKAHHAGGSRSARCITPNRSS